MERARFKTGLVIGKFYPPHKGHSFLVSQALNQAEKLAVVVVEKKEQTIPAETRAKWIKELYPAANVYIAQDIVADGDDAGWVSYIKELLGSTPDVLFTSEAYGDAYARALGNVHVLVDRARVHVPISATLIRENPEKYIEFLEPNVRAYFLL